MCCYLSPSTYRCTNEYVRTIAGPPDQHVVDEAMRKTRLSVLDFPLRTIDSEFEYDVRFAVAREEPVSVLTRGMPVRLFVDKVLSIMQASCKQWCPRRPVCAQPFTLKAKMIRVTLICTHGHCRSASRLCYSNTNSKLRT